MFLPIGDTFTVLETLQPKRFNFRINNFVMVDMLNRVGLGIAFIYLWSYRQNNKKVFH